MEKQSNLATLFNLREVEMNLYEALVSLGQSRASTLAQYIGISRTAVYDLLDKLVDAGFVVETLDDSVKIFSACSPEKVQFLLEERRKQFSHATKELEILQTIYTTGKASVKPRLQLFEGKKALQQMMKDMLLYRDIEVFAYWPINTVMQLLGVKFFESFHNERVQRNMALRVIWPNKQKPDLMKHPFLCGGAKHKRTIRIAPSDVDFSLGYSVYGDTVRFISSSKENFGFLVESKELAEMMRSQFQLIWEQSKPVK